MDGSRLYRWRTGRCVLRSQNFHELQVDGDGVVEAFTFMSLQSADLDLSWLDAFDGAQDDLVFVCGCSNLQGAVVGMCFVTYAATMLYV